MTLGEKITKLRKSSGYSQEAFGEVMGVSRQAVSKWENDTAQPTAENLSAIAKLFGVPLSSLLDDGDIVYEEKQTPTRQMTDNGDKIFKRNVKRAVVVLAVICIFICVENIRLNRKIDSLENSIDERIAHHTNSLQSRINNLSANINRYPQTGRSDDFVDSDISVVFYDFETDTAVLEFSFIPSDYTRQTVAKVGIKSALETKETVARQKNGMFVAQMEVQCRDDISTYFYLIDGEKTRSFSMGMIENPVRRWALDISKCSFYGDTKVKNGTLEIDGRIEIDIGFSIDQGDKAKSVYPQKAVIEVYEGERLVTQIPDHNIMDYNYIGEYDYEANQAPLQRIGNKISFRHYFEDVIEDEKLKNGKHIRFVYVITDNNGNEYRKQALRG